MLSTIRVMIRNTGYDCWYQPVAGIIGFIPLMPLLPVIPDISGNRKPEECILMSHF